jgi:hypothetical protein
MIDPGTFRVYRALFAVTFTLTGAVLAWFYHDWQGLLFLAVGGWLIVDLVTNDY